MYKHSRLFAVIVLALGIAGAAPAEKEPVIKEGLNVKCGIPPEIPGKLLGCRHDVETGRAGCAFELPPYEGPLGIAWIPVLTLGSGVCGAYWEPVSMVMRPVPGQQIIPAGESL